MENVVILGDCLKVMKSIADNSIDLIVTDPPYGMDYQSSWRTDKYEKILFDQDVHWFPDFAKEAFRVLKNNSHIYVFCNDYSIEEFKQSLKSCEFNLKRTLVWVKNNHTSGDLKGDYANKTEFILFAHKGRKDLNEGRDTNVLNFARVESKFHPTTKPEELMAFLIRKSSDIGEVVLDPFLGSGTTAVAAQKLGRKYIGIELSPQYHSFAVERLKQKTLL